jgi:hypothetical protein
VCSNCGRIIGARYWLVGDTRLLCDACGQDYEPGVLGAAIEGPFKNDRSSVGPGGKYGV